MNWSQLFFWKKQQKHRSATMPSVNFDQKLIKKNQSTLLPNWSQLRYLENFLTKFEKRVMGVALAALFITSAIWGVMWFFKNNAVVPASGGDYSEALIGQPKYINPLFASANDVDADLSSLIYSGLFHYNEKQKLIPDLASDYTVSNDGKTYDINLRKDIRWSDNEPFNADDVIYTFETIQDPLTGSPLLAAFQSIEIERTDDYSVRFVLKEPFAPFLSSLTVGILPQHAWINVPPSGIRLAKTNLQPVGSGPWKFSKLTKDSGGNIQSYELKRNETYYKNAPHLKTLTFKFYTDYSQAVSALKSQEVMAVSFLPRDLANKITGKNFKLYKFKLPQYTAVFFNQNAAPDLKDSDTRLALSMALDKNEILAQALDGEGEIINSPILKDSYGYNPDIAFPAFDKEKANQILDKNWEKIQPEIFFKTEYDALLKIKRNELDALKNNTGTPIGQINTTSEWLAAEIEKIEKESSNSVRQGMEADQSFYRKNTKARGAVTTQGVENNKFLTISITTVDTPEYQKAAQIVAKMWRAIGIKTKIQIVNSGQIVRDILRDRNYDALLYGEIAGSDPDPYPFWHSSQISYPGLNLALFANRAADKLLEDARVTTTEQKRAEQYEKFQQILAKEIPAAFLYSPTYNFIANKEIKGIDFKQIFFPSDRFNGLSNWYIKTKRQWIKRSQ
jgi:ABC-type transport system substrate-binding protein